MPRVLVIDDSRLVLSAMRETLERAGMEVETALGGAEGVSRVESFRPDVIISDLEMPELDGLEVVRRVHASSPETPVLILTEHGEVPLVVQSMREGAFGYLRKGIRDDAMVEEINAALKHRAVLEQNRKLQELARQYQAKLERMVEEKTAEVLNLQKRQAQTEKMAALGTLLAGVAHEVNNPLAVIRGNIEWLQESIDDLVDEQVKDPEALLAEFSRFRVTLAEMATSSERIERLIARLRRLSHPGREKGQAPVEDALGETAVVCKPHLNGNAELTLDAEPELPPVALAVDDLVSVLSNLIINACHAVKPGEGQIALKARREEGRVRFEVTDNGSGIDPAHLTQVFDPFFTTKAPGKGSGLGLSLVYQIVTAAGGEVQIHSEKGKGTRVELKLPAHA